MRLASSCSASSKELLNEDNHFILLDGTRSVLIEGSEHLIEGFIREFISGSEVSEGILDKLLGFLLVEGSTLVDIICVPDLVNNTLDGLLFS